MLEQWLVSNVWFTLVTCILFSLFERFLAGREAYLYHTSLKDQVSFQGLYDRMVITSPGDLRRWLVNGRFIQEVAFLAVGLLAVWHFYIRPYHQPHVLSFIAGGILLLSAAQCMRHFRNLSFFDNARRMGGLKGRIEYTRRISIYAGAVDLLSFAALYGFLSLVAPNWFFLGGALFCALTGMRQRDYALVKG